MIECGVFFFKFFKQVSLFQSVAGVISLRYGHSECHQIILQGIMEFCQYILSVGFDLLKLNLILNHHSKGVAIHIDGI